MTYAFLLSACTPSLKIHELAGPTMGTQYHIKVVTDDSSTLSSLQKKIDQRLLDINQVMSTYIQDSELSTFNQFLSEDWFAVSNELFKVVNVAEQVSHQTEGAFDITVGPLVNLWGFGPDVTVDIPSAEQVQENLERTGYQLLKLDQKNKAIKKAHPDLYLDLSAIAKGYAVDAIASLVRAEGMQDFLVEIGGELKAEGKKPDGSLWHIAVESPVVAARKVEKIIDLENLGVATSGDYRNFFEHEGKVYSHTIDPQSGYPVDHGLASVTVLHESTMWADAYATAFMVLGPEKGMEFAEKKNLPVFFIIRKENGEFEEQYSKAFASYL